MSILVPLFKKITLVSAVCLLVACGGSEERKSRYMQEGKQLFTEGNYQKAMLSYKNVLQIDPKDPEARYQMAEALNKMGELQNAVSQYLAVIGEDPKHVMSRVRMGEIYLMVKQIDNAVKMAEEVKMLDPENIDGKVLNASMSMVKNDTHTAMSIVQGIVSQYPDHIQANLLKATLEIKLDKIDQAVSTLQALSEKKPTEIAPLLFLTRIYIQTQSLDKAQQVLESIVKTQPQQLEHRVQLAIFLVAQKQVDAAEKVLRTAIEDLPEEANAKLALVQFLVQNRTPDTAIAELLPMIEKTPDNYYLRFKLVDLELIQKHFDKVEQTLKDIIDRDKLGPQGIKARTQLARGYFSKQRITEAKALIQQVLDENPLDRDSTALRGEFYLSEGQLTEAIGDFRSVLVDQPKNIRVYKLLSRAHLLNNEPLLAIENLEKILEFSPNEEAVRLELVGLLAKTGDNNKVTHQMETLLNLNPQSKLGLETAFKLALSQKQWDKAQITATQIQNTYPKEGLGYFFSGLGFQAEGKHEASVHAFEQALDKQPDALEPLTQLVKTYVSLKQLDKAIDKLNKTIKAQPENVVAYNLLGGIYLNENKLDNALNAFKKSIAIKPEWWPPYRMLALTYAAQGKRTEGIKAFEDGIVNTKSAMELVNDLASIYMQEEHYDKGLALYEAAYQLHPQSPEAINNLVSYLSDYSKDPQGIERAAKLAEPLVKTTNPDFLDTLGWLAYQQGDYAKAGEILQKSLTAVPNSPSTQYHLGMVYYKQNDTHKAHELLEKALDSKVKFMGVKIAKQTLDTMVQSAPLK